MADTVTTTIPAPTATGVSVEVLTSKAIEVIQRPGGAAAATEAENLASIVLATAHTAGWKSSEFWITLLVVVGGCALAAFQMYRGQLDIAGLGAFLGAVGKAAQYTHSRTTVKVAEAGSGPAQPT